MAGKLILALFFTIFFISQAEKVSSTLKKVEDKRSNAVQSSTRFGGETRPMPNQDGLIIPPTPAPAPAPGPIPGHLDCGGLCKIRCSVHSRPNVCLRSCGTCCVRCKCVPPGTFGNKEMCGKCYTDMVTHGNKPKCP